MTLPTGTPRPSTPNNVKMISGILFFIVAICSFMQMCVAEKILKRIYFVKRQKRSFLLIRTTLLRKKGRF